eukprot:1558087-Amphidinium_carterae.1
MHEAIESAIAVLTNTQAEPIEVALEKTGPDKLAVSAEERQVELLLHPNAALTALLSALENMSQAMKIAISIASMPLVDEDNSHIFEWAKPNTSRFVGPRESESPTPAELRNVMLYNWQHGDGLPC